jgi:iron complex transport system substrate-binding protein
MSGATSAAGTETQADGIIKMAGGRNIFSEFRGYKQVSEEALWKARPDIILVASHTRGGDLSAPADPHKFLKRFGFRSAALLEKTKFVPIDMGEFLIIGPRAGETTLRLAKIFYGLDTPAAPAPADSSDSGQRTQDSGTGSPPAASHPTPQFVIRNS